MEMNRKSDLFNNLYIRANRGNMFYKLLYNFYTQYILGCDIKCTTTIGTGFQIFHSAHASVVSPGTIIGNNVSLRQNTTIGAKGFDGSENSPVIEDNVVIGPNVCIIGNITIGEGAIIGAGAVVVKDVPPHAVVVGNPARSIKSMKDGKLINVNGGGKWIKSLIRNTPIYKWKEKRQEERLASLRLPYLDKLKERFGNETSIICSNCFAGRIMQDIDMQYNTPTLGLYFFTSDYIEFLKHLDFYLKEAKIEFVEHSKYSLGDERRAKWRHWYPVGLLGGKVEIHFLHYHTEEAAEKWYRRASRVHFDNLFIIGMEQNLCTEKEIREFDELPFKNKVFFSSKNIEGLTNNCLISEFKDRGEVGDPYKNGHILYRYLVERI